MTDYALVRARSTVLPRSSSLDRSPSLLLTRTRSVPDLTSYYRWSDKYKPQWHTVYQTTPYKWRRDWDLVCSDNVTSVSLSISNGFHERKRNKHLDEINIIQ
uniref:Uncharacterized protein n=1 Tax=Heterorhabditis bacteriophora TaxID=37862 RepID=A0A1I7X9C7_HETBA